MFRKVLAIFSAIVCVMLPAGVSAENNVQDKPNEGTQQKFDISKLNDTQKADLQKQLEKMIILRKETVQKMVDNGTITKEQGDRMLQNLDERMKAIQEGDLDLSRYKKSEKKDDKIPNENKPQKHKDDKKSSN